MDRLALLRDPAAWQACSFAPFDALKPQDVFDVEYAHDYVAIHSELWDRFTRLHTRLVVLEQLHAFPFNSIYSPYGMDFWIVASESIFDSSIVLMHSLAKNTDQDECGIQTLESFIRKSPWRDEEKKKLYLATIKPNKKGTKKDILSRVATARNKHVAHHIFSINNVESRPAVELRLHELFIAFQELHLRFGLASFGSAYCTLTNDTMPTTQGRSLSRTCLDSVLDAVLKDSDFVNRPERRGAWWSFEKEHMSLESLELLDELRSRVGLPRA